MRKILIIARKELISTLRQRNLVMLMFVSPLVLGTIFGLAFGGLGRGAAPPAWSEIPIAVVNLDEGFAASIANLADPANPSQAAPPSRPAPLYPAYFAPNLGNELAALLLAQPETSRLETLDCPLPSASPAQEAGSLAALFNGVALTDPVAARLGVARGDFTAAVIIPPDFSEGMVTSAALTATVNSTTISEAVTSGTVTSGTVEVVANGGAPIAAGVVQAVVTNIVSRFARATVALDTLAASLATPTLPAAGRDALLAALAGEDATLTAPLACLWRAEGGNLQIAQQPLDPVQAGSIFAILMVTIGGSQAIFFALFTGVFGINSIYEDRIQGTLPRLLVTPTPSSSILAGRLLGNLLIVMAQLTVLFLAFTAITSLVEWQWLFIWGNNPAALLGVILGLGLFATGLGALIVGLARTSEQVQIVGPLITISLSMLSGSFGFALPASLAQLSPIWWGLDALRLLASHDNAIGQHLVVLFSAGLGLAALGTFFFRRRMGL